MFVYACAPNVNRVIVTELQGEKKENKKGRGGRGGARQPDRDSRALQIRAIHTLLPSRSPSSLTSHSRHSHLLPVPPPILEHTHTHRQRANESEARTKRAPKKKAENYPAEPLYVYMYIYTRIHICMYTHAHICMYMCRAFQCALCNAGLLHALPFPA